MEGSHRLELVGKIAEAIGMNDVDDMPEFIARAKAVGKKLGGALREK